MKGCLEGTFTASAGGRAEVVVQEVAVHLQVGFQIAFEVLQIVGEPNRRFARIGVIRVDPLTLLRGDPVA